MEILKTLAINSWQEDISPALQDELTSALEDGQVLYLPKLAFHLEDNEEQLLLPEYVSLKSKNISFSKTTGEMRGFTHHAPKKTHKMMLAFLERFADQAHQFINQLFPHYRQSLIFGRTSFRPIEVKGRPSSYRKDDARLHVDAFPSSPNHGKRIIRLFCNINPSGAPRVWRLGEPFEKVVQRFLPKLKKPFPGSLWLMKVLGITRQHRTLYDHFMLQLHDLMKADDLYQQEAEQQRVLFAADSTWIVQTDQVSHAAMAGQYVLEQTFYLPADAMKDESKSPLRTLERAMKCKLT